MREKTFPILDRLVLIPVELTQVIKPTVLIALAFFVLGGLGGPGTFWSNAMDFGLFAVVALVCAVLAGAVLTPVLLPWVPGRAFSIKGCIIGIVVALVLAMYRSGGWEHWPVRLEMTAWFLVVPALAAYLAMNFTGASTYTSLSGVRREMRFALPSQIAAAVVGVALWLGSRFTY
jgi:acetyl-CoA decarbonylase/synthase complex subunit gamma